MCEKIVFNNLRIPVEKRLVNMITTFKNDFTLSIEGVRVSVISTQVFFHVLTWKDIETLHRIGVDLGDYLPTLRRANPNTMQKLLIRRAQYASQRLRGKKGMWALT